MAIANISPMQQRHSQPPAASSLGNITPVINNTMPTWRLAWLICLLGGSDRGGDMGSDIASYQ